jgi:prepilin-type N-terminal cleavage/methylation domain-containing protein/prepilin-type processing-associated H-X9-DG protein
MKIAPRRAAAHVRMGFTLIELSVVIAIIAILAAILFPVFGRARENARRSSCQSNLKQLGLGVLQYAQDFDEYIVPAVQRVSVSPVVRGTWRFALYPYVKSTQVFSCPSNPVNQTATVYEIPLYNPGMPSGLTFYRSYAANSDPTTANFSSATGAMGLMQRCHLGTPPVSLSQLTEPARGILIAEQSDWTGSANDLEMWIGTSPTYTNNTRFQGHLGTSNFLFADGHVKALKLTATATASPVLNMWTVNPTMAPSADLLGWLAAEQKAIAP